jgi:hypothetical protein
MASTMSKVEWLKCTAWYIRLVTPAETLPDSKPYESKDAAQRYTDFCNEHYTANGDCHYEIYEDTAYRIK